jgi:hypothetical protein
MEDLREITLCEPAPFIYYENGQLAVTDGATVWILIVTCEAMKATASPPEKSLRRLVRYAEFYRDLATAAIQRGEDIDGKVFITESDVLAARPPSAALGVTAAETEISRTHSIGISS